ncbi:MAG TPA: single-stranded-DNA-specific exonuclease RecJ [Candidatus Latescibacteria bacterium]|nr:single-stranded-DNA-specific exonuclease RecJ [Candidatus Latescibacterota bacterium]
MTQQSSILDRRVEPRWDIAERPDQALQEQIKRELKIPTVMAKILINRGIRDVPTGRDFLYPSLDHLIDPFLMADMHRAVARIWQALDSNEAIMVHGDYDVDGVTGTALIVNTLKALGADVSFYIPHRLEEGYGISKGAIDICVKQGRTLLVSVDCGITAIEETRYANEQGVDVIITDHHQSGELPEAVAVINPKRPDCPYPFKELPGVALAFKLADAVYKNRSQDLGAVYKNLDLVALGCAADIVPLVDENRVLVTYGLGQMECTENPGLKALLSNLNLRNKRLGTGQLIFVLAPRINALGRMGSAMDAVTLLTTPNPEEADRISQVLEQQNLKRRQIDEQTLYEALEMVEQQVDPERDRAVVLSSDAWHPGVIGIVASRIAEKVHLPTVLIAMDGAQGKGSGRSIPGFDLYAALSRCQQHLAAFGGHKYAAGLTIDRDRIEPLREAFLATVGEMLQPEHMIPQLYIDDEISLGQIDARLMGLLRRFAPFGPQNMRPVMVSRGVEVVGASEIVGKNHIKFKVRQNGRVLDCIGFDLGHLDYRLAPGEANLDIAYMIEENEWRGRKGIQLRIKDLR